MSKTKKKKDRTIDKGLMMVSPNALDIVPKSNPVGRPSSFKPEYCEMIIDIMGQGFSKTAFAGKIGVALSSIYEWESNFPQFSEAIKKAEVANANFWENLGIMGSMGLVENFNSAAWIFNMKNRHKWRDKQPEEVTQVNVNVEKMSDEELEKLILEAARKINDAT